MSAAATTTRAAGRSPGAHLAAGRLMSFARAPYYRQAVLTLAPVESTKVPTLATSEDLVMYWNPGYVAALSVEEVSTALLHEALHAFLGHFARQRALHAEPETWNTAGDLAINCILRDMGCTLNPHWLVPEKFRDASGKPFPPGLTAEEYYALLQQQGGKGGKGGKGSSGAQGGQQGQERGGAGGDPSDDAPGAGGAPGAPGDGHPQVCAGGCGGVAGNPHDGEPDATQRAEDGARSPAEVERLRRQIGEAIQNYAAKNPGKVPAGLLREVAAVLAPPKVKWQEVLAIAVRQAVAYVRGLVDHTHARPSRRQEAVGGYAVGAPLLGSFHRPVPRVMVAFDTSGSMGAHELEEALVELDAIVKAVGGEVEFVACDAEIHATGRVHAPRDAAKLVKGGGGTDFRPIFKHAMKSRRRPSILVIATDGYGPAPTTPPFATIWLLVGRQTTRPTTWGTYVETNPKP